MKSSVSTIKTINYVNVPKDGDPGPRGPFIPPPMLWEDYPSGYAFKRGAAGEPRLDIVLRKSGSTLIPYECIFSHTKDANHTPGTPGGNIYWRAADSGVWEMVATRILLATYALVDNLGVKTIEMYDASGNPLFVAKDGKVTCRTGAFNNVEVTGTITANVLQLTRATVSDTGVSGIPNGTFLFQCSQVTLPALSNTIRIYYIFNPMETRTTPENLTLVPQNTNVRIVTGHSFLDASAGTRTVTQGGYNSGKYWQLTGMNVGSYTYWILSSFGT